MTKFITNGALATGLVFGLALGACAPKIDPTALELLRQQQAAEAARQQAEDTRKAADKAFEKLDRDTR